MLYRNNDGKRIRFRKPPRMVFSKIVKSQALAKSNLIGDHLPVAEYYTPHTLEQMLNRFSLCFLKPDCGLKGQGVILVRSTGAEIIAHHGIHVSKFPKLQEGIVFVESIMDEEQYIVQQGIKLLRIDQRPLDFRISLQKPYRRWLFTGIAARQAAPGKIVTNRSSGGTVFPFDHALAACAVGPEEKERIGKLIYKISLAAAAVLDNCFPGLRELAVDLGLDQGLHPWILEVNTRPAHKVFGLLPDQTMYKTILSNHRKIWQMVR